MEKYGFVYIWRDRKHKRYYIGSHWGFEDDGYICSSTHMNRSYRRRPNDFKRKILKSNIKRENLLKEEHKWLSLIKKEELGKKYYNLNNYRFGHWTLNENSRLSIGEKISKTLKNNYENFTEDDWIKFKESRIIPKHSEETKLKMSISRTGKKLSEETKMNISKAKKGRSNGIKGRICSEETRKKIGAANAIKSLGNKNRLGKLKDRKFIF